MNRPRSRFTYGGRTVPGSQAGFTLVEAIVSLVLLGLLLGSLYTLFSSSLQSWRRAETSADEEQNVRLAFNKLTVDLENLVAGADAYIAGSGPEEGAETGGWLQLVTAAPTGWPGGECEVLYSVDEEGLHRQVAQPARLRAVSGTADQTDSESEAAGWSAPELLSPLVRAVQPEFMSGGEWQVASGAAEGAPQLVRVTLQIGAGEAASWQSYTLTALPRVLAGLARGQGAPAP